MIGIFSGNSSEVKALLSKVHVLSAEKLGVAKAYLCEMNSKQFVIVDCGYGKVNLGGAVSLAVHHYQLDTLIGVGDCGSVRRKNIEMGNVAISSKSLEYDVNYQALNYPPMVVAGLSQAEYPADTELVQLAKKSAKRLHIEFLAGTFGTADRFVADDGFSKKLYLEYGIEFIDSECAALGQFAFEIGIPYVFVKGICNYANSCAVDSYYQYREMADKQACMVVYGMLEELLGGGCDCNGKEELSIYMDLNRYLQLTQATIKEFIATCKYTTLCVAENNQPYAIPMAFSFKTKNEQNIFCLYSKPQGQKMQCIHENDKVALSFSKVVKDGVVSVMVYGVATIQEKCLDVGCNENLVAIKVVATEMTGRKYFYCSDEPDCAKGF